MSHMDPTVMLAALDVGRSAIEPPMADLVTTFPLSLPQPVTGPTPIPRSTAETLIYDR